VSRAHAPTLATQLASLRAAVRLVLTEHPLPSCDHGHALADHAGDTLEPPCGCRLLSHDADETSWQSLGGTITTTRPDGYRQDRPATP
jgi:hypothetical protein